MSDPLVTLIVCTHNRRDILDRCLGTLLPQASRREDVEILVVDNACADATPELLADYARRHPRLRWVREPQPGLSRARNRGWREARSRYLTYLDDDTMIPDGYVDNLAGVLQEYQPDLLGGPIYPYYTSPKPAWFKDAYEIRKFADRSGFSATCRVSGGNYTIRRDLLEELGLFDTNLGMNGDLPLIGEERQVLEKYRAARPGPEQKVYYSLECQVLHHTPAHKMTVRYMMQRYFTSGRTMQHIFKYDKKHVLRHLIDLPGRHCRRLFSEIRQKRKVDCVNAVCLLSYDLGLAWQYAVSSRNGGNTASNNGKTQ